MITPMPDTASWDEIDAIQQRFETVWNDRRRPNLGAFLEEFAGHPQRPLLTFRLIRGDLWKRLRSGDIPPLVPDYLVKYRDILARDMRLELIRCEYRWRWQLGDTRARREEYRRHRDCADLAADLADLTPVWSCPAPGCNPLTEHTLPDEDAHQVVCPQCQTRYEVTVLFRSRPREPVGLDRREYELPARPYASGGMGQIYLVRDPGLGRELALKVVHPDWTNKPRAERRLRREAQIVGALQHPAIVPIHNLGRLPAPDGRLYFTMKLIRGRKSQVNGEAVQIRTLADELTSREVLTDELPRLVAMFAQVCQAVAFAHQNRVIHRDLKPANIMVGEFGEIQVTDWGLAKTLEADAEEAGEALHERMSLLETVRGGGPALRSTLQTRHGEVLGSLLYLSPEQAQGETAEHGPPSDVFALGAILCEVLTGFPPYVDVDAGEAKYLAPGGEKLDGGATFLRQLLERAGAGDTGPALRRLEACKAHPDLVRIARDCLARDMAERPADASQVADRVAAYQADVQRRAEDERVQRAKREEAERRADAEAREKKQAQRAKRNTRIASVLGVVLLLFAGGTAWWNQSTRATRRSATILAATSPLDRASALINQGWAQADDPDQWKITLSDALSLIEQANGALSTGEPTDELRARVERVRRAHDEAFAELALIRELEAIWLRGFTSVDGKPSLPRTALAYAEAFRRAGADVLGQDAGAVRSWLEQRRVRDPILLALQDSAVATQDEPQRQQLLSHLISLDGGSGGWRNRWILALHESRRDQDHSRLSALLKERDPGRLSPAEAADLGNNLAEAGAAELALPLLQQVLARHPGNFRLNEELGRCWLRMATSQPAKAIPYLRAAAALRPKSTWASYNLGTALLETNELTDALAAFQHVLAIDEKLVFVHINLGNVWSEMGKVEDAARCYKRAIELEPKNPLAYRNLGRLQLLQQNNTEAAIDSARKEIDSSRDDAEKKAEGFFALGTALHMKGELVEAIAAYEQVIKLNPKHSRAHVNLGEIYASRHDWDAAVECLREGLKLDPTDALGYTILADCLGQQKDFKGAIQNYHTAIALSNQNFKPYRNLGLLWKEFHRDEPALIHLWHAAQLAPDDLMTARELGLLLIGTGDREGARPYLTRASSLAPDDGEVLISLGKALMNTGRFDEAREMFRRADQTLPKVSLSRLDLDSGREQLEELSATMASLRTQPADERSDLESLRVANFLAGNERRYRDASAIFASLPEERIPRAFSLRFWAARANLAACYGLGQDAADLGEKERLKLWIQGIRWLRAELNLLQYGIADNSLVLRIRAHDALASWEQDDVFRRLRNSTAPSMLSAEERQEFEAMLNTFRQLRSLAHRAVP
jgi:serine/threonine protein kinase/Flp pilus assembly protein TadD